LRSDVGAFFAKEPPVFEHRGDGLFHVTYRAGTKTLEVYLDLTTFIGGMANARKAYEEFVKDSETT
jgi:hypothetical protein